MKIKLHLFSSSSERLSKRSSREF